MPSLKPASYVEQPATTDVTHASLVAAWQDAATGLAVDVAVHAVDHADRVQATMAPTPRHVVVTVQVACLLGWPEQVNTVCRSLVLRSDCQGLRTYHWVYRLD